MSDIPEDNVIDEPSHTIELSHREKALRDLFVKEYLTDYDAYAAAIRIRYPQSVAKEYAVKFMHCPYVLKQIHAMERDTEEESPEVARKLIIRGLTREANYKGPGSSPAARVAALAKLAAIQGIDAPRRDPNVGPDGLPLGMGGMFVVPGILSVDDWEKAAAKQQEDLVSGKIAQAPQVASN